jgi:hypothetical protein
MLEAELDGRAEEALLIPGIMTLATIAVPKDLLVLEVRM